MPTQSRGIPYHDFAQLLLGLVDAGHVVKGDRGRRSERAAPAPWRRPTPRRGSLMGSRFSAPSSRPTYRMYICGAGPKLETAVPQSAD